VLVNGERTSCESMPCVCSMRFRRCSATLPSSI